VGTHVPIKLSSTILARAHELNLKTWVPTFLKKHMNLTDLRTSVPTFLTKPTNIYQFLVVFGGRQIVALGEITMPVTFGFVHNTRTDEQVVFDIVDMEYPYNAIIG
jgi:hypothetical protein